MAKKGGLGKGLNALFIDNDAEISGSLMQLRLSAVEPNKDQPRGLFDQDALEELADSIREHGVLQPIVVRTQPGGVYQIIAGERRWRASRIAGLSEIPAIVVEADDNKVMELALIENLQRENLNPIEEAQGYRALIDSYHMTQEQVAKRIGKSRPVVTTSLRLLTLPEETLRELTQGRITPGHARVLAGVEDPARVSQLTRMIVSQGLTVRQLEKLSKADKAGAKGPKASREPKEESSWGDSRYKELEISLQDALGRRVRISKSGKEGSGTLEVAFHSLEELREMAERLAGEQ